MSGSLPHVNVKLPHRLKRLASGKVEEATNESRKVVYVRQWAMEILSLIIEQTLNTQTTELCTHSYSRKHFA